MGPETLDSHEEDRLPVGVETRPAEARPNPTNGAFATSEWDIREGTAHGEVLRREARYRRALALADVVSAACAVTLGLQILGDDRLKLSILAALPLVVLVGKLVGLYDRDENLLRKTTLDEAPAIFQVATLYTLLIWLADSLLIHREEFRADADARPLAVAVPHDARRARPGTPRRPRGSPAHPSVASSWAARLPPRASSGNSR